jgi:adenylate cyclase, class 2
VDQREFPVAPIDAPAVRLEPTLGYHSVLNGPPIPLPHRNLELKARDPDPARYLQACLDLGAADQGTLHQSDTYFGAPHGRLKLREEPDRATLIAYDRPDLSGSKESRYRLVDVPDPGPLREALTTALGVTVVVTKSRRLFLHENVRIHLDQVDYLGTFIEFEAVATEDQDPSTFKPLLDTLREHFAIPDEHLLHASYSDLLREART